MPLSQSREWRGILFLAGTTAVGKTEAALALAEDFGAEIIGADALQVYQGLDLLTAKPEPQALARVRHHLVGTVPLTEVFSAGRYRELALAAIAEIRAREKPVLVTGGTGLYLRALMYGLDTAPLPAASPALRAELAPLPLPVLLERLTQLDPEAPGLIDTRNPRRVSRALEICLLSGQPFSRFRHRERERAQRQEEATGPVLHATLLERDRAELHERIRQRAAALFEGETLERLREEYHAALLELPASPPAPTALQVIGWREISAYFAGTMGKAEARAALTQATRRYAKRQRTWFRRETAFLPLDLSQPRAWAALQARAQAAWGNA